MDSAALEIRKSHGRSRVTNGGALFACGVTDGRSAISRRFRDILSAIVGDLGGSDRLSEGQRQLPRRIALMSVRCESMEARSVAGEEIDIDMHGQLSDRIGRAQIRDDLALHDPLLLGSALKDKASFKGGALTSLRADDHHRGGVI